MEKIECMQGDCIGYESTERNAVRFRPNLFKTTIARTSPCLHRRITAKATSRGVGGCAGSAAAGSNYGTNDNEVRGLRPRVGLRSYEAQGTDGRGCPALLLFHVLFTFVTSRYSEEWNGLRRLLATWIG